MQKKDVNNILDEYLNNVKKVNNILLGCTHFPLLYDEIQSRYPNANLIDPAKKAVEALKVKEDKGDIVFYVSKNKENFKEKALKILGVDDIDVRVYKG